MVDIWPFKGTRPYNQDAKSLIAPSTDHLSIENIEIFKKNNYWNYLKILNPVGQLKETDTLKAARDHFDEMKYNHIVKQDDVVVQRPVKLGINDNFWVAVLEGLDENESIVIKSSKGSTEKFELDFGDDDDDDSNDSNRRRRPNRNN